MKNCGCGLFLREAQRGGVAGVPQLLGAQGRSSHARRGWIGHRATELGYSSVQDAMAAEHSLMSSELMRTSEGDIPEGSAMVDGGCPTPCMRAGNVWAVHQWVMRHRSSSRWHSADLPQLDTRMAARTAF